MSAVLTDVVDRLAPALGIDGLRLVQKQSPNLCKLFTLRLFIFALLAVLCWVSLGVATFTSSKTFIALAYDVGRAPHLRFEVTGCDVHFRVGDAPSISYVAQLSLSDYAWTTNSVDGQTLVIGGVFGNQRKTCAGIPAVPSGEAGCEALCVVQIDVPAEASSTAFVINQATSDESHPRLVVDAGVVLGSLSVYGGTMDVDIANATMASTYLWLASGSVRIDGADIPSITVENTREDSGFKGEGVVHVLNLPAHDKAVTLNYRQPSSRLCLASNAAATTYTAAHPLSGPGCDLSGEVAGTSSSYWSAWSYSRMRTVFDTDGNGRVTLPEFTAAKAQYVCCGGSAPFYCDCNQDAYTVFPPVDSADYDRFDVTFSAFSELIFAANATWAIERCHQTLTATPFGGAAAAGYSLNLQSWNGEVIVTLDQAADGASASLFNQSTYAPPNKVEGLLLQHGDAQRLMTTYGKEYADQAATASLYLVIDVQKGVGVPPVRWIYASNPVFLILDPALLSLLTLGMLVPTLKHERVTFLNNNCVLDEPLSELSYNETLAQMHTQLFKALHSSAFDKSALRGALVLLSTEYTPALGGLIATYFNDDISPSADSRAVWSDRPLMTLMYTAFGLSLFIGGLGGAILLPLGLLHLRRDHKVWLRARRSARKMVLVHSHPPAKGGGSTLSKKAMVEYSQELNRRVSEHTAKDEENDTWSLLLRLIKRFTTEALAANVDSVALFVHERCETVDKAGHPTSSSAKSALAVLRRGAKRQLKRVRTALIFPDAAKANADQASKDESLHAPPFVYMRRFFRQYELFCLDKGLPFTDRSRAEVQRYLVLKYDLRIPQLTVKRLRGLRWKPHVLEAYRSGEQRARLLKGSRQTLALETAASRARMPFVEHTQDAANASGDGPDRGPTVDHLQSLGLAATASDAELSAWARGGWVKPFLKANCEITREPSHYIDFRTRADESGQLVPGLGLVLYDWYQRTGAPSGKAAPNLFAPGWPEQLPLGVVYKDAQKVRQIYGLRILPKDEEKISFSCLEIVQPAWLEPGTFMGDALTHITFFIVSTLVIFLLVIHIHTTWSVWVVPPSNALFVNANYRPMVFDDIFCLFFPFIQAPTKDFLLWPVILGITIELAVFAITAVSRLLLHESFWWQSAWRDAGCCKNFWAKFMVGDAILLFHAWAWLAYLVSVVCWVCAAAVLQPTLYLPYGVALVTVLTVGSSLWQEVMSAVAQLRKRLRKAFLRVLKSKLTKAREKAEIELYKSLETLATPADDSLDAPIGHHAGSYHHAHDVAKDVTASDVFALLLELRDARADLEPSGDTAPAASPPPSPAEEEAATGKSPKEVAGAAAAAEGEAETEGAEETPTDEQLGEQDFIEADDFHTLFNSLDLNLTEAQCEKLFAMTDLDGSGTVGLAEFEDAWEDLIDEFLEASVIKLGLSQPRIFAILTAIIMLLITLIAFVLLVVSAWTEHFAFDAIVQSALVAGAGRAAKSVPKPGDKKHETDIQEAIEELLSEQYNASNDA